MFARRMRPGTAASTNAGLHIGSSTPTAPARRAARVVAGRTDSLVTSSPAQAGEPVVSTAVPATIAAIAAARIPVVIVFLAVARTRR